MYLAGVNRDIDTADTYFLEISKINASSRVSSIKRLNDRHLLSKRNVAEGKPLEARAEHARWIVDCDNCGSAEFYWEDGLFLCTECNNSDTNGAVKKVKLPKVRKDIEKELGKRKIINRHWYPGETIDKLKEEVK